MKLIHTADWHLGNTFHGHARTDEHRHFLEWLLGELESRRPDALIVAGDVFDSANPPAMAEKLFYDFLTDAVNAVPGLQIVVTAGNHDSGGRLEAAAALLRRHNIYVRGTVQRLPDTDEPDFDHLILPLSASGSPEARVVCFALPYLRAADYPSGLSAAEGIAWYLKNLRARLDKSDFRGLPVIVAAHFYAARADIAACGHSERLVVGGQDAVEADAAACGAAYTALGHIHKPQRVAGKDTGMYYAGSALPMSFAEKDYRHGAQWIEIDNEGRAEVSRIDYTPRRTLMSIPGRGAARPQEILDAIAALPQRQKDDDGATWPYLEIRVEESRPEPELLHQVEQALEERAVRFCRMVRETPPGPSRQEQIESFETLRRLSPLDMARRVYESRYHTPMPAPLEQRFTQAEEAATQENPTTTIPHAHEDRQDNPM